ncbi:MAG: sugar nucleotide-binding protein, partial [Rhodobacteraceae bacterium]|nr:sugar nucleotide-binding protein [Paracoccaceae bacterium]
MKILCFGQTGQVAIELARNASLVEATITCLGRDHADLTDPAACAALVTDTDADIIINAAAYTAVDAAEQDQATARRVNGDAPGAMARAAAARSLPFLHISTDYVFDGTSRHPWHEEDPVAPLGVYGASKLEGERQVTAAGGPHLILRTAWVYSAHGKNFVKTMLRLGAERDSLSVVADQQGGP